jgi:hypothetical protein
MAEPTPTDKPPEAPKKGDDAPGKSDALALGIGCLVFVIFFIAIVMVGATRE